MGQLDLLSATHEDGGDVAYTPPAVVAQHLEFLERVALSGPPSRILAPAAGAGAWVRAMRRRWPNARIVAIELNHRERENLQAAGADEVHLGDGLAWAELARLDGERFDLIADNPPWSNFGAWVESLLPLVPFGHLQLYGPTQWGQAASTAAIVRRAPPRWVGLTGGRIRHHGDAAKGGDLRETCSRIWRGRPVGEPCETNATGWPSWVTYQLPMLTRSERRHGHGQADT